MSDQPDKLFREKLYGYQRPVPPKVWSQVSANLNGRRRLLWWRSAAASIALLCVAGIAIYPLIRKSHTEIVQPVEKPAGDAGAPLISQLPESEQKPPVTSPAPAKKPSKEQTSTKRPSSSVSAPAKEASIIDDLPVLEIPEPQPIAHVNQPPQTSPEETTEPLAETERSNVTIVFTAEEVNKKYLSRKGKADATSADQETSRLKNMLDKAYDLTHNQDPIGDLRQKKNEIFALNFRKGRPDTQND